MMKKRLRFQLPHVPLKVLRGEKDQEDVWDRYHERFQAPGTTTDDAEDDRDIDDDSGRSSLSYEGIATDNGEVSDEGMARYLGGYTDSVDTMNDPCNASEYDTIGSINLEAADVQVAAEVHHLPDSDITSNDDTAPLLINMH